MGKPLSHKKKRTFKKNKDKIKTAVLDRFDILIREAQSNFKDHKDRSNRYVQLIFRLSNRNKTKIPNEIKRQICKKCESFLKPGDNARVRIHNSKIILTCLNCNNTQRFMLKANNPKIDRRALKQEAIRKKRLAAKEKLLLKEKEAKKVEVEQ